MRFLIITFIAISLLYLAVDFGTRARVTITDISTQRNHTLDTIN